MSLNGSREAPSDDCDVAIDVLGKYQEVRPSSRSFHHAGFGSKDEVPGSQRPVRLARNLRAGRQIREIKAAEPKG